MMGTSVPEGFTLPWNTEWTMADAWGVTERQCRNISYRTERVVRAPKGVREILAATVWTPNMVRDLKAFWAEGKTCTEIARRLGKGFTKNSVAGKAHRLDLPPRKYQAPRRAA